MIDDIVFEGLINYNIIILFNSLSPLYFLTFKFANNSNNTCAVVPIVNEWPIKLVTGGATNANSYQGFLLEKISTHYYKVWSEMLRELPLMS